MNEWQDGEDQREYLGTGRPKAGCPNWERKEPPIPAQVEILKYPEHFTPKMREMHEQMTRQMWMCRAYFELSLETALDVLKLVLDDEFSGIRRERFS